MVLFSEDFTFDFDFVNFGEFDCFLYLCIFLFQVIVLLLGLSNHFGEVSHSRILGIISGFAGGPLIGFESALAFVTRFGGSVDDFG